MSKKLRTILAIIGVVMILLFTVMTIVSLFNRGALQGFLIYIGLFCGVVGVVLYLIVVRDTRENDINEALTAKKVETRIEENMMLVSEPVKRSRVEINSYSVVNADTVVNVLEEPAPKEAAPTKPKVIVGGINIVDTDTIVTKSAPEPAPIAEPVVNRVSETDFIKTEVMGDKHVTKKMKKGSMKAVEEDASKNGAEPAILDEKIESKPDEVVEGAQSKGPALGVVAIETPKPKKPMENMKMVSIGDIEVEENPEGVTASETSIINQEQRNHQLI